MNDIPNQAVAVAAPKKSVIVAAANRFNMEPEAFEKTLRGTVFPTQGTPAEFAAFLVVANEYGLNPITREIYAYPKKGGGIQPIVSIDGWARIINEHPQFDGMEFTFEEIPGDPLKTPGMPGAADLACTCTMWRKDRSKPIVVTEYLSECYRQTDPWRMRRRMLRHKTLIQTARYAFGFSSIMDEDEAAPVLETLTPVAEAPQKPARASSRRSAGFTPKEDAPAPQPAQEAAAVDVEFEDVPHDAETGEVIEEQRPQSQEAETRQSANAAAGGDQSGANVSGQQERGSSANGAGAATTASASNSSQPGGGSQKVGHDTGAAIPPAEAAAAGVYFHVQSDRINASGQRPFYDEDGQRRGFATEEHGIRVATDITGAHTTTWAPKVEQVQQVAPPADDAPWDAGDEQDDAPRSPWDVFDALLMSSSDWAAISSAMVTLAKDPVWNGEPANKQACRQKTFAKAKALGIDPAKDATAFQCFLAASDDPADITAIFGDAMREPWYTSKDPTWQAAVTRAVMGRTKELGQ